MNTSLPMFRSMSRSWLAPVLMGLALLPAAAQAAPVGEPAAVQQAREAVRAAMTEYAAVRAAHGLPAHRHDHDRAAPPRGLLGFRPAKPDGQPGLRVEAVQPDSAAARAGLQVGDRITAINGRALGAPGDRAGGLRGVKPGEVVALTVQRGTDVQVVSLTAEAWRSAGGGKDKSTRGSGPADKAQGRKIDSLRAWRLEALHDGLAPYFAGQRTGVLVLRAPEADRFDLRAGDVVVAVDGTPVNTPPELFAQLIRGTGPTASLEVLRAGSRLSLSGDRPQRPERSGSPERRSRS